MLQYPKFAHPYSPVKLPPYLNRVPIRGQSCHGKLKMLDMVCSLRFVLNPKRMTLNFNSDWNWSQVYTVEYLPTGFFFFFKSPPCAQRYKKCKKKKNPRNDPYSILLLVEVNKTHSALKLQPRKIQENFHS